MCLYFWFEHQPFWAPSSVRAAQAERESFGRLLLGPEHCGLADAFRARHPGVTAYTYWDHKTRARERNSGWRLDYCLVRPACVPARRPVCQWDAAPVRQGAQVPKSALCLGACTSELLKILQVPPVRGSVHIAGCMLDSSRFS